MQFILRGFSQAMAFRVFAFEGIAAGQARTVFTVRADLGLTRKYGIRLQDLPLLCREVLERRSEGEQRRAFTYTEQDMGVYADCAAEREQAARKKKAPRRPATDHVGTAWRIPPR